MSEKEVFEVLDLYDNTTLDNLLKMTRFSNIVNFNELYKKWRKQYIESKRKGKTLDLDEYAIVVARRSKSFVLPVEVKKAILMKRKHIAIADISRETNMTLQKLNYLFSNAFRIGFLDESNFNVRR
jgi:hypothetical protein